MPFRRGSYTLTPPTMPVFVVALVLTIVAALLHYRVLAAPALSAHSFEMMFVAAVLLIAGSLFRGI